MRIQIRKLAREGCSSSSPLSSHAPALSERTELDRDPPCSPSSSSSSPPPHAHRPSPHPCPSRPSSGSISQTSSKAPLPHRSSIPPSATTTTRAPSSSLVANPPAAYPHHRHFCPYIHLAPPSFPPAHLPAASTSATIRGPFLSHRQIYPPLPRRPGTWPSVAMTSPPASPSLSLALCPLISSHLPYSRHAHLLLGGQSINAQPLDDVWVRPTPFLSRFCSPPTRNSTTSTNFGPR